MAGIRLLEIFPVSPKRSLLKKMLRDEVARSNLCTTNV